MLTLLLKDLRLSLRLLTRNPAFACVAIAILALGIGANATVFSLVDSILLEPLDYPDASRLVQIWEYNRHTEERSWVYHGNYRDWKERARTFDEFALYNLWEATIWGDPEPERVKTAWVTGSYFELLGAEAQLGRALTRQDETIGNHRVAVISHSLWQRRFGGDPEVIGATLRRTEHLFEVVGVMPPGFRHPAPPGLEQPELWVPSVDDPDYYGHRSGYTWERAIGRLKPGVGLAEAQLDMDRIARELEAEHPDTNTQRGVVIEPMQHFVIGDLRTELRFLLFAVGLVLVVVCANLSSLVTVRSAGRRREMAVRMALGGRRRRLVHQLVAESLVLALAGGTLGILLASGAVSFLRSSSWLDVPRAGDISLDATAVGFTLVLTLAGVALFGLLPAMSSLSGDLHMYLKAGARGSVGHHNFGQRILVAGEVALALVLVVGAGLLGRSYQRILDADPGFRPQGVLTLDLTQGGSRYDDKAERVKLWDELTRRLLTQPGIRAVGGASLLPLLTHDDAPTVYEVEGREPAAAGQESIAQLIVITPGYQDAMGLTVAEGRGFDERDRGIGGADTDASEASPGVVVVNRALAERVWPGESAVGKRLRLPNQDDSWWAGDAGSSWLTVVGVLADVRLFGLDADAVPEIYRPHAQDPWTTMSLVVRSDVETASLMSVIRREVWDLDPNQPLRRVTMMTSAYDGSLARRRLLLGVLGAFAASALVLAAVGIYGVMAWSVAQRTREIGLRMAVGARAGDVVAMVLGQSGRLFSLGVVLGLPLAWMLTRTMSGMLFGVGAFDLLTFLVAGGVLAVAAFFASLLPSWRAARVDPLVALRYE